MRGNIGNKIYRDRPDVTTLSGSSPFTLDMQGKTSRDFDHSGSTAFTVAISNMVHGAILGFRYKKTGAGDVVVTFPANTVSNSTDWVAGNLQLTLSGSANKYHEFSIATYSDGGTIKYFLTYSGELL